MQIATNKKQQLKLSVFILAGVFIFAYFYLQLQDVINGPNLHISTEWNGTMTTEQSITIAGTSNDIAGLAINGRQIFTDTKGNFVEDILLLDGYNVIEIKATDRLDRSKIERIEIVRQIRGEENSVAKSY